MAGRTCQRAEDPAFSRIPGERHIAATTRRSPHPGPPPRGKGPPLYPLGQNEQVPASSAPSAMC
eukprot:CAMPEP_0181396682 /NCGR_PEP_ID=MMETSP1110-20121109/39_1 /TAXON_ID=174948 /ORGANISM="Symbiodinium sp., Strain CCMP421" /LENGTH=63 /DNA_ID=CAMNT_0023518385 /DNA_START=594 /DNA_END=785 /DNA_ORIENTATION=-